MTTRTVFRTCTLCEAACGLKFEVDRDRIVSVRPDDDDVLSHGHVCPKGIAIADVHHDPDRLRQPLRRNASGEFEPISWDDAFELVASRLLAIKAAHGADAIAVYTGNPIVHNYGALLVRSALLKAVGTHNSTSAGSQDTSPRFVSSYLLYGSSFAIPIPDVDRTDHFLCIGANPTVSNGSFLTAPDMRGRMRAIRDRGGKIVVVDPRFTETARDADEHVQIRPGADAALLLAMVHVLVRDGKVDRERLARDTRGWDAVESRLKSFAPETVADHTGLDAPTIERLAHEFVAARKAVAYSRVGVCNNRYATVATWATDVLNIAADRLGREGGAMFTTPAFDLVQVGALAGDGYARWRSRVRGLPETAGDVPASTLAEEMETPGPGQVRALVTFAGNPVLSTPNGRRLDAALRNLEFMVSIDIYLNETTRHADVILPPSWALAEDHVDVFFASVFIRNVARWSPPVVARGEGELADWQILLELTKRLGGGPSGMPWMDRILHAMRWFGYRWTPSGVADLLLRVGPHGDRFLPWSKGLNLKKLQRAPHGIDLGPLQEGFAQRVLHADHRIHLDPEPFMRELDVLAAAVATPRPSDELLLIGRREVRTNNSWMHNVRAMVTGRERCVLFVHPDDAARARVKDGEVADLESRVHRGPVRVRVTKDMRPGVVSLPHGWGHQASAPWQRVAGSHPGVSANDWTDDQDVEAVVGQSILNGVPVRLHRRAASAEDGDRELSATG